MRTTRPHQKPFPRSPKQKSGSTRKHLLPILLLAFAYVAYQRSRSQKPLPPSVPADLSSLFPHLVQPPMLREQKRLNAARTLFLIPGDENRCHYRFDYVCKFWFYIRCYAFGSFENVNMLSRGQRAVAEFTSQVQDGDIAVVIWRSKNHDDVPELLSALLKWRHEVHATNTLPRVRIGVFHIANENNRSNWEWYALPDFVIRNYWIPNMPKHATFVPLGPQLPNGCTPWSTEMNMNASQEEPVCSCKHMNLKLASARTYLWNFSGSLRRKRGELLRLLRQSNTLKNKGYVQVAKKFGGDGVFGGETENPKTVYLRSILDSQFVFAPCGNAMETHRIYEAIALGAIPVIENCDPDVSHFFPFQELLIAGGPAEMVDFVDKYVGRPDAVDSLQAQVQAWWRVYKVSIATNVSNTMMTHVPPVWKTVP